MTAGKRIPPRFYMAAAASAAVLGLAVLAVSTLASQRSLLINTAQNSLLLDATLLARNLEGVFRVTDAHLGAAAEKLAAEGGPAAPASWLAEILAELGARIPESDNVYLLDGDGRVLSSSYPRRDPSLALGSVRLSDLGLGGSASILGAQAPAEGGSAIVSIRPFLASPGSSQQGNTRSRMYLAAVFSGSLFEERLELLRESGNLEILIANKSGAILFHKLQGDRPGGPERTARPVQAEAGFRAWPLTVTMRYDLAEDLGRWRERAALAAAAGLVFAVIVAVLAAFGLRASRRARMTAELERELEAKDLLFKEVNHRVKNNLAIVASMLTLGEGEISERPDAAAEVLRESVERILSMALLHEQLYKLSSLASTDFGSYLGDLARALRESYDTAGRMDLRLEVEAGLSLPLAIAVPLALIANELVTNAYKYAFPTGTSGSILIGASKVGEGDLLLKIADDGIGDARIREETGFGMTLVRRLTEQIKAELSHRPGTPSGLVWELRVPRALVDGDDGKAGASY